MNRGSMRTSYYTVAWSLILEMIRQLSILRHGNWNIARKYTISVYELMGNYSRKLLAELHDSMSHAELCDSTVVNVIRLHNICWPLKMSFVHFYL